MANRVELFTIQCTTCRARLKVNDESVIGDILACPKCQSMVQVVPPEGWQRPGSIAAAAAVTLPLDTTKSTGSSISIPQSTAAAASAAARKVVPPALPTKSVAAASATKSASVSDAKQPTINTPSTPTAAAAASVPPSVGAEVLAAPSAPRWDWLLLGSGVVGGIVLGAGIWFALTARDSDSDVSTPSEVRVASKPIATPTQPAEKPADAGAPTTEPAPTVANHDATTEPVPEEPVAATEPSDAAPAEPNANAPSESVPAPKNDSAEPSSSSPPAKSPALKLEPSPSADAKREPAPAVGAPSAADKPAAPEEAPVAPKNFAPADPTSDPIATPALAREDVESRLTSKLSEIKFHKVPLSQFVDFVADASGLTIVIDDSAIAKVGKSRKSPITLDLADATTGEALRLGLERLGLTWTIRGTKVVITVDGHRTKR